MLIVIGWFIEYYTLFNNKLVTICKTIAMLTISYETPF